MSARPLPPGVRRVVGIASDTGLALADALADDGRIDVAEAAQIALRLVARVIAGPVPSGLTSAAWHDMGEAIRRGDQRRAHAALDRAMGWTDATSDSGGPDR